MHLFAKLCKIFQNAIAHIHYKEKHIWKVMHFFTMICIQSLPSYTSLLVSSSPRYHSLLDPRALYASSVGISHSQLFPFVHVLCLPLDLRRPRAGLSSASFSACVLAVIPPTQGSLNMCLLTVTLVAVFMHLGWKRDFLSCSILKNNNNNNNNNKTCRKIQSELLQD